MDKYGLFDEDGTLVDEIDNDDGREKLIGGRKGNKFPVKWILDNGYLAYLPPDPTKLEKIVVDEFIFNDLIYTRAVRLLTQDELDDLQSAERVAMSCTLWQFRKAINATGRRGAVTAYLATASQDEKDGWDVASQVERMHPNIDGMKEHFNMTDKDMDDLFELAVTL